MSTSSRLLAQPSLDAEPCTLEAPPPAADPFVERLVDTAARAAYQRGVADGEQAARAALDAAVTRLAEAFAGVREEVAALRRTRAEADVALAEAIATAVLGAEPHDGGRALLARLERAMAELDDAPLTVRVHPGDADLVTAALASGGQVTVEADPALEPGEALVSGPCASAELTRPAAWEAVRAVTGEGGGVTGATAGPQAGGSGGGAP